MITLNSESLSIYLRPELYDVPLLVKVTQTGEEIGDLTISRADKIVFVRSLNLDKDADIFVQEILLSLSQYLIYRQDIIAIDTSSIEGDMPFEEESEFITESSIKAYMHTKPVVRAAIVMMQNQAGELLMGLRPEGLYMPGLWEFPGGKIEPGETPEEAGIRELQEELGINIREVSLIETYEYAFRNNRLDAYLMLTRLWDGIPTAIHHKELIWVSPENLVQYNMPLSSILFMPTVIKNT